MKHTTLCGNDTSLLQGTEEQLKVRLLEQAFRWPLWVGRVGDDNIELVLIVIQELETVPNVNLDFWVLVADGHTGKVFLGETNDSLVAGRQHNVLLCAFNLVHLPHRYRREWPPLRSHA